jgi:gas vesicle protein
MEELKDECEIVINKYREFDATKKRLSISNDQNKYQKVQNDYRVVEKEAEELNDNLTGINSVLVRINRALRRYELCQMLMKQVSEEAESTLATFKQVYGEDFLDDDLKIKEEFEKFIQDKNYQLIIQESKQKGDVAFADFIQETKEIKRIGLKLWETLKIASEMTKVQQMYITSVDKDVRTIKAFVGNNSTFVQLLVDKTKQIEEKNQTKQAAIGDWKDKFIDWITKAVNNVKSFFTNLNNKIKDFFNKNNEGLEALENKLTELENALK